MINWYDACFLRSVRLWVAVQLKCDLAAGNGIESTVERALAHIAASKSLIDHKHSTISILVFFFVWLRHRPLLKQVFFCVEFRLVGFLVLDWAWVSCIHTRGNLCAICDLSFMRFFRFFGFKFFFFFHLPFIMSSILFDSILTTTTTKKRSTYAWAGSGVFRFIYCPFIRALRVQILIKCESSASTFQYGIRSLTITGSWCFAEYVYSAQPSLRPYFLSV